MAMNTEVDKALSAISTVADTDDAVLLLNVAHSLLIEAMQTDYPFTAGQVSRLDEIQGNLWKIFD
jgi:hypothetical protein